MPIYEPTTRWGTGLYSGNFPKELPTNAPIQFKLPKTRGKIGTAAAAAYFLWKYRKRLTGIASPFIGMGIAGLIESPDTIDETLRPPYFDYNNRRGSNNRSFSGQRRNKRYCPKRCRCRKYHKSRLR